MEVGLLEVCAFWGVYSPFLVQNKETHRKGVVTPIELSDGRRQPQKPLEL